MCGMSKRGQYVTEYLLEQGADAHAIDCYGFMPLHRMASNNLDVGAHALLKHGADPNARTCCGQTPMSIAKSSRALQVMKVLEAFGAK